MKRVGKNIRPYLDKARDSALLAVEIYNKPAIAFKSAGYIALMSIAWTSLLHAIFLCRKQLPYHKGANGRYRSAISAEVQNSGQFSFKAFLIQVANHQSQDALAIQFVQYDKLTEDQKAEVSRLPALIKLKSVGIVNADLMKAGDVVRAVQASLGNPKVERNGKQVSKFNQDTHVRCWRRFNVRPPTKTDKPEFTDQRFCSYDKAHRDYLYTPAWVDFLVEKMKNEEEYTALFFGLTQLH